MLCTASYHHLQKDTERQQALSEMYRCLKSKGRVLLTVWATEGEGETSQDTMIPWKLPDGTVKYRYYRKYVKGDVEKEVERLEPRFVMTESGFDRGNWFVVFQKK